MRPRPDDPVDLLRNAVDGRRSDLLPVRWARMAASPFGFFRGAAALMAADLGPLPSTGLDVQVCGDAHLLNLGAYAAPDGHLVFDLNDFDETCRGPFEWDLERLSASVFVGGRTAGLKDSACKSAVRAMVEAYRDDLDRFSRMRVLQLARYQITPQAGTGPLAPIFRRAERHTPKQVIERITVPDTRGFARFRREPPLLVPLSAREARPVLEALPAYQATVGAGRLQFIEAYAPWDVAFKVVGTGSVGADDYLVLLYGNGPRDPLFLQIKEADASCWMPHLRKPRRPPHEGRRVAEGQHRTQTVSDPFLGWTTIGPKAFVVRRFSDHKAALDVRTLSDGSMDDYAVICGRVLAKAHARTGDASVLSGYCGRGDQLDRTLTRFARDYADQTEADHALLCKAIRAGRLEARDPVG